MSAAGLLAYWEHTPHPFLIQFSETVGIRFYGLAYLLGFVGAAWLLRRYHQAGRTSLDTNSSADMMLYIVAGVVLGGRLGYFLLYQPTLILSDPLALIRLWEGGMASHGGFAGVAIALAWFSRTRKLSFLHVGDLIVTTAPLGLMLGRLANFANGELWGRITNVPWAVVFERSGGGRFPRHPSQLYEAALEGLLLLMFVQFRFWRSNIAQRQPGRLAGEFLMGYAAVRAVGELYREPDAGLILGLSRGTFYSAFLVAGGLWLVWQAVRKSGSEHKA